MCRSKANCAFVFLANTVVKLFTINFDTDSTRSDTFGIVETTYIRVFESFIVVFSEFGDSQRFCI